MKLAAISSALALLAAPAIAQPNPITLASDLAVVLASEKACDQPISEAGVAAFIEKNVPANDIEFPGKLMSITAFQKSMVEKVTGAQKVAHCIQVKRLVQAYGLAG